jgi:hypothetical protein
MPVSGPGLHVADLTIARESGHIPPASYASP